MAKKLLTFSLLIALQCLFLLSAKAQAPTLYYPKDKVIAQNPVSLRWNTSAGATSYEVQYADNVGFVGATTVPALVPNSYLLPTLATGKYYFWRVRAQQVGGPSAWSPIWRFGIFLPTDWPSLSLWISADGQVQTDVANRVTQWTDMSGQGNNVVQTNAAKQPLLVPNVFNGKPVIRFDGNNVLTGGDILDINSGSRTAIVLAKTNNARATFVAKSINGNSRSRWAFFYYDNQIYQLYDDKTPPLQIGVSRVPGNIEVVSSLENRALQILQLRANSNYIGTTLAGVNSTFNHNSTFRFLVGGYNDATDVNELYSMNGDIAEIMLYDAVFADSVKLIQEKYLMDKYYPPVNLGADINIPYSFCDTVLDAGAGFVTYAWTGGATTRYRTISTPGTYMVTATDVFLRSTVDTIIVQRPDPNYTGSPVICLGGSATWNTGLNPARYNFNWSNGSNTSAITITTPGTYRVTVTDTSGCSLASAAVVFTVDSFKQKVSIITGTDTSLCSGNRIGLARGASLVSQYLWSTAATTPTIPIDTSGDYSLTVTNANGCIATDTATVIIIGEGPNTQYEFDTVCVGQGTQFTDLSTITPPFIVNNWQWNFGDSQTSTSQNPIHYYATAGTYTVSMVAFSNGGCSSSPVVKQVLVRPNADAFFNQSQACTNTNALFFDASTAASGDSILSYYWDFGNSDNSTLKNPATNYLVAGNYSTSLVVQTQLGCIDTFARNITVVTTAPPPGVFSLLTPIPGDNLTAASVLFTWQPSANAIRYQLQVATNPLFTNPVINTTVFQTQYTTSALPINASLYHVRVIAYSVCGDSAVTTVHTFNRFTPTVYQNNLLLWVMADGTVVKDASNLVSAWTNQAPLGNSITQLISSFQPTWLPSITQLNSKPVLRFDGNDFLSGGDVFNLGSKSRSSFIVGRMNGSTNTYYAKTLLSAANNRYALFKFSNTLYSLVYDQNSQLLDTINLTAGRYELINTNLDRRVGSSSLYRNSLFLRSSGGLLVNYNNTSNYRFLIGAYNNATDTDQTYYLDGDIAEIMFFDTLLTTTQRQLVEKYIYTKYSRPVWLGPDITINYGFCDSVILNASNRYVSYLWNTGATTSTLKAQVTGTYWVEVKDVFDQIYRDTVNVTLPSVALPTVTTICLGDSITWNANLGPNYSYNWNVPNNTTPTLVIANPGSYFITISDTNHPACTYVSKTLVVQLDSFAITTTLGPDTSLCGGATIGLKSNTQNIIAYNWSDNSNTPTIVVNNAGTYWVNALNVTGCQASDTINVAIAGRLANVNFTVPNAFCIGDTSNFTNTSTIQPPYNITGYKWKFAQNGDSSTLQSPSYYYSTPGTYTVNLAVTSDSGCVASLNKTVQVFNKPSAKFAYQIGCAAAPIIFSDQSVGVANDALAQWFWTFGDDSTSAIRNPSHIYTQPGIYAVSLTVTSTTGCSSVFNDTLEVFPPLVVDIAVDNLCFGETTQFKDASPAFSNITWLWEFGANNNVSTLKNPTYNYTQTGSFIVKLTVKNSLGCISSTEDTITIVQSPTANFTYNVACESLNFRLNDASTTAGNDPITKWLWEFNDGGLPSNAPNPVRTYDTIGTFNVKLSVESANGCPATITKPVTIAPAPIASFTFTPDYGAAPLPVTYTNTSVGATSYQWYFSDGGTSQDQDPVHTFTYNNDFGTTLVAIGPGGCKDTASSSLTVNISTLDIAIVEINAENVNGRVRPYATIINQGTRNVDHYYLTASLGDGSRITERVDTFLRSGTGMVYYFVAGYEATEFQASSFLCIQASQPNDEVDDNAFNDRLCKPLENDIRIVPPYPNPTNGSVSFEVLMPREAELEITMYDVLGHRLMTIYDALAPKGTQTFKLDMNGYPRGVYILKVRFNDTDDYILKFVAE